MSYPNHVRKDGYVDVNTSVTIFMFQCFIGCVVQNLQHLEACPCGYIYLVIIAAGCSRVHLQNWLDWICNFASGSNPLAACTTPAQCTSTRVENTLLIWGHSGQVEKQNLIYYISLKKGILVIDGNVLQIFSIRLSVLPDFPSPLGTAPCLLQSK